MIPCRRAPKQEFSVARALVFYQNTGILKACLTLGCSWVMEVNEQSVQRERKAKQCVCRISLMKLHIAS